MTVTGNPAAAPAVALAGESVAIARAEVSATVAVVVCVGSSTLVALIVMLFGSGAAAGAVYTPLELIVPHDPLVAQETCQVTPVFDVPSTVVANSTVPDGATTAFTGATATTTCAKITISAVALSELSAAEVADTYASEGLGTVLGAR